MTRLLRKIIPTVVIALMVFSAISPAAMAAAKDDALYQKCEEHKATLLTDLENYVNIDTGSGHEPGLKKFQGQLIERLKELGAEVTYTEVNKPQAGYNIKAVFRGTGKGTALILAHADTVYAAGTAEKRPFSTDGIKAYGPGVSDEKGGLTLALHALAILKETDFQDYDRITFLINPDEEKSSLESRDLIMQTAKEHKYALCVEPGIPGDYVMNWRKGIGRLTMQVSGRNAHAGIEPEKGRNATVELAHQIVQLSKLGDPAKMTTVNWTLLDKTKTPVNVIPDAAWAQADIRVLYPEEYDRIMKDAKTISQKHLVPDTKVELDLFRGRPPFAKNDKTDKLVTRLQNIYDKELGLKLGVQGSGGGSDANYAAIVGAIAVDGLGIVGGNDHTPEEFIEVGSITPRLYLLTRILMDIGSGNDAKW
ncbi:glutamate carboxypeptidase [Sporomusa sp.]|uniref:glutamate carboxypeptidase n=1 Tax=Sporomusa sp. TaxID=2078658 RepID=UPI002C753FDC|nr:glutamate carboxypeptidase [Sporomusa sp.]HWR43799.1 glutamate carboxypeptidase [Sporomusa sp.]